MHDDSESLPMLSGCWRVKKVPESLTATVVSSGDVLVGVRLVQAVCAANSCRCLVCAMFCRFYSELQAQEADMRSGGQRGMNPHLKNKKQRR